MGDVMKREVGEKGVSAGTLVIVFLVWAVVCAVFFGLGFMVGYNEQPTRGEPVTEHVSAAPSVPHTVTPPAQTSKAGSSEPTAAASAREAAEPPPERVSRPAAKSAAASAKAPTHATTFRNSGASAEAEPASPSAASREVRMGFTVQVDALRAKPDAEALVKILKARRYPVFLVTPEYANSKDNLYRVQVGPFTTREDAEKVRDKLAQEGFKPFIRR
jgi:cell division septation protein DedD